MSVRIDETGIDGFLIHIYLFHGFIGVDSGSYFLYSSILHQYVQLLEFAFIPAFSILEKNQNSHPFSVILYFIINRGDD
jgi:hypothetical protein